MKKRSADMVELAERIARAAHAGQFRRDGVTPYIRHPENVARRVRGNQYAEAVGWLHDVLEDTKETAASLRARGVPSKVVACVTKLTKRNGVDYDAYLAEIRADPLARKVKIADMLSNLADMPTDRQIVKYARGLLALVGDLRRERRTSNTQRRTSKLGYDGSDA